MIDRLTLPLLLAGCLLLAAILVVEVEPSPAPWKIATAAPPVPSIAPTPLRRRAGSPSDALSATALARPLFSSTRRPPPHGGTDGAADSGLADTRLAGILTEPGRRIAIFAPSGAKPADRDRGRNRRRMAGRQHHPRRGLVERPGRDQDHAAEIRSEPDAGRRTTFFRQPTGRRAGRRAVPVLPRVGAAGGPARGGAAGLQPWAAAPGSARAAVNRRHRPVRLPVLAAVLILLASCQAPPTPSLTPLEQPAALQPAAPRVSGPIPGQETSERAFEDRRAPSRMAAGSAGPPPPGVVAGEGGDVTLNFVDTDIREIARTILGTTLKLDFTIDPSVHGTGSIETATPLPRSALLPALETLLNQNGATMVQRGGLYAIVPIAVGAVSNQASGASPVGAGAQVVPLRYTSAKDLAKILEPYIGEGGKIAADPARNAILVTGDAAVRQTVVGLIRAFDIDILSGRSYALVPGRRRGSGQDRGRARKSPAGPDRGPARRHCPGAADGARQRGSRGLLAAALSRRRGPLFQAG